MHVLYSCKERIAFMYNAFKKRIQAFAIRMYKNENMCIFLIIYHYNGGPGIAQQGLENFPMIIHH